MRQTFLLLAVLLLGLSWAAAQDSTGSAAGYGQSQTSAGGEMTVQGCLNGSNGSYTLTDKKGNTYQLTGDTAKLNEHVGHEVKISGTSSSDAPSASASGTAGSTGSEQTLQVSSVKHISKTCSAGGSMTH